mmetsp:Transcript_1593/g.3566  ORF Transcript_1593/g.3566 Transcript_1593/m.3566 type:complete len:227 (-) Transcript_1593:121-801(-)
MSLLVRGANANGSSGKLFRPSSSSRRSRTSSANHTLSCNGTSRRFLMNTRADFVGGIAVRPYTLRKGDTATSIAEKRSIELKQIRALNPLVKDLSKMRAGDTILLPASKLSKRDKDILHGIHSGSTRLYPVRQGETIEAIIKARGVTLEEAQKLNPGANLKKLKGGEEINLPSTAFTVREKEWLQGAGIVPKEYFGQGTGLESIGRVLGLVGVVAVITYAVNKAQT